MMNQPDRTEIDQPTPSRGNTLWGSDAIAMLLRKLDVKYVALNPGSSFRGLHDSLVNYLGNREPQMLLCLHEEHAVALAHGYAKVTGEPIVAILHSNVGLMHGAMAIYNAWCDRAPVLVLGATGPMDAAARRPWIDWLHTARDQGAIVRHYVKWDDQPLSLEASVDSILRAWRISTTAPHGPVYVCLDVTMQEAALDSVPALPDVARYRAPEPARPSSGVVTEAAALLRNAKAPLILAGRVSRDPLDWTRRIALAEALGARVLTDIKVGAAFPTDHPLHRSKPTYFLDPAAAEVIRESDVILSLDWVDLGGTLKQAGGAGSAKVVQVSLDHHIHNGWSLDHQGLAPADINIAADPDRTVEALAAEFSLGPVEPAAELPACPALPAPSEDGPLDVVSLAAALGQALTGEKICFVRLPLGWAGETWHFRHPLDYLGSDGGAGIGSGPGMLVGAALALEGSGRLPVAVLGDGDTMMGVAALWTAAHYKTPFVAVISNNRSFFNDEIHQERVAKERARPVENKWIGQRMEDPDIDIAAIARAQGLVGIGPVRTTAELTAAVRDAVAQARAGASVVIDARVAPGYNASMSSGMTRKADDTASD